MNSLSVLYLTDVLLALVAVACTVVCIVWSVPSWRNQLGNRPVNSGAVTSGVPVPTAGALSGWSARVGSGMVSVGIGACALLAWYGCWCVSAAL